MTEVKDNDSGSSPEQSQSDGQGQVKESQVSAENLQREVEGLKQGIQAEREKRQSVEQQYKLMEQLAYAQQHQPKEVDFDPDDVPTNSTVQQMIQREVQNLKGMQNQMTKAQQIALMKQQDPDFNKLVGVGSYFDDIQKEIPGLLDFAENHPMGVEFAYRVAKSHPEYQKMLQEKAAQDIVSKTEKNLSKPPKMTGGGEMDNIPDFSKMSDADLDKEIWKTKFG